MEIKFEVDVVYDTIGWRIIVSQVWVNDKDILPEYPEVKKMFADMIVREHERNEYYERDF